MPTGSVRTVSWFNDTLLTFLHDVASNVIFANKKGKRSKPFSPFFICPHSLFQKFKNNTVILANLLFDAKFYALSTGDKIFDRLGPTKSKQLF